MSTILDEIIQTKRAEVAERKKIAPVGQLQGDDRHAGPAAEFFPGRHHRRPEWQTDEPDRGGEKSVAQRRG